MRILAALVLLALPLPGTADAATVRDMLGREVALAAPPARIVCLVPSVTETIFALGGQARLAGVTDFCDHPPAARSLPRVGGMVNPSVEAIAALRPDLVIATSEGNREETLEQVRRLGVPVYVVRVRRLADMLDLVRRVGGLVDRRTEVDTLVASLQRRVDAVREAVRPYPRPRVLYVLWPEPLIVPGRRALVTELIDLAGGRSVTADDGGAYPRLSLEAAVARAPEIVLLADHATNGAGAPTASPEKWRQLGNLSAIRDGRVRSVDATLLHRYGPRLVDGLEALARVLHPRGFP